MTLYTEGVIVLGGKPIKRRVKTEVALWLAALCMAAFIGILVPLVDSNAVLIAQAWEALR